MRFSVILLALGPLLAFAAPIAVPRDAGVELKREDVNPDYAAPPLSKRDSDENSVGSPPWKRDSEADGAAPPGWKRDDSSENGVSTPPWKRTKSKKRDDDSSNDSVIYSDW
ncbi:hypothetical protein RSAG8_12611, partial [Rhizoctonia solani AG-8 WAC10335]